MSIGRVNESTVAVSSLAILSALRQIDVRTIELHFKRIGHIVTNRTSKDNQVVVYSEKRERVEVTVGIGHQASVARKGNRIQVFARGGEANLGSVKKSVFATRNQRSKSAFRGHVSKPGRIHNSLVKPSRSVRWCNSPYSVTCGGDIDSSTATVNCKLLKEPLKGTDRSQLCTAEWLIDQLLNANDSRAMDALVELARSDASGFLRNEFAKSKDLVGAGQETFLLAALLLQIAQLIRVPLRLPFMAGPHGALIPHRAVPSGRDESGTA